jgi:ankyrin repeat protein
MADNNSIPVIAIVAMYIEVIKFLLINSISVYDLKAINDDGETPLHWASS